MINKYKQILLGFLLFSFAITSQSQNISNYTFAATSGTYQALSGATSPALSGGATNDGWYNSIPIGFDFWFMGVRYNTIGASTNGWMCFGSGSTSLNNAVAANSFSSNSVPRPFVAPLWDDLDFTQSLGIFSYKTTGAAPNRIFTAEWFGSEWAWSANAAVISFQVKLNETTGKVDFIYNQELGTVASGSASIGIQGTTTYQSLNGTGTSPASSTTVNTTNLGTKPATGQVYSFTPPIPAAPTGLSFTAVTQNSMNLNWTDNASNEIGYAIFGSTDNITFTFQTQVAANSITAAMLGLLPTTPYYYKVYAVTEGGMSNVLSGSQTTLTGTLSGVITIPGNYATITAAIAALQASGFANSVVLELQSSYTSTGETFPITIPNNLGATPTKTIILRPAAGVSNVTILSSNSIATILINGGKYFKIDGRPGGTGTTKALTISNNYSGSGATDITFINDACNDTVRYCNIIGMVVSGTNNGLINFSSTTGSTGNDSNSIEYCDIHGGSMSNSYILINGFGSNGKENNSNTIANNLLYDFTSQGINLINYCTDFRITGNHIYQTQPITSTGYLTMYGIFSSFTSGTITISNNYIGGSTPFCAGNAWELGSVSTQNRIYPIYIQGSTALTSSIIGNTISNFLLATNYPGSNFIGIYTTGLCNIIGNTIGSSTGTGNIMIVSEYVGNANIYGICTSNGNTISNNLIGSIDVGGTLSTHVVTLYGILSANNSQITGNTITNLMNESTSATIWGISSYIGSNNISLNTISNLYSTNTASAVTLYGISSNNNDTINRNLIHSFSIASSSASSTMSGIYSNSNCTVKNNMIRLGIKPDGTSLTTPSIIYGVYATGVNALIHNSIYIGGIGVAAGSGISACYYKIGTSTGTLYNNIFYNARANGTTGGNHYNLFINSPISPICNYNLHYTGVPLACMIYSNGTTYTNFATYQTATGLDANSVIADPRFVNPTGNSSSVDLHINNAFATPVESYGSSAYTTTEDFDGQLRSSFSPVDIGADAGLFTQLILPVKWLSFEGRLENKNTVLLTWRTASEINNDRFVIQRTVRSAQCPEDKWEDIGTVKGNGNTNQISEYQFTDNLNTLTPNHSNTLYYRLKQIDADGNFEYSKTITVSLAEEKNQVTISPNPFSDKFELIIPNNSENDEVNINVKDINGRNVFTKSFTLHKDQPTISVETNSLINGIYFIEIQTGDGNIVRQKMIKL